MESTVAGYIELVTNRKTLFVLYRIPIPGGTLFYSGCNNESKAAFSAAGHAEEISRWWSEAATISLQQVR